MTQGASADPLGPAVRHLEAGEFALAQAEAGKVLAADPSNSQAMLILSGIAGVQGQARFGRDMMSSGSFAAITDPDLGFAIGNLFLGMRKNDKAAAAFARAVALRPDHQMALRHLAYALRITGKLEESIIVQEKLVAIAPESVDARITLAETLHQAAQFERCVVAFDRAIARGAGSASIYNTLSTALYRVGENDRAAAAATKALEYQPNFVEALVNLGNGLCGLGRFAESEAAFRKAIELAPRFAAAHSNLAMTLNESRQFTKAIDAAQKALALQPDLTNAHVHLANALHGLRRIDEAMVSCRNAIAAGADHANAHLTLSKCLTDTGRAPEALAVLRECAQRNPDDPRALGNLVMALNYDTESAPVDVLATARQFDERFCKRLRPALAFGNSRDAERKLRVGYVSADFCEHVVGWNILPLLREHDPGRYQVLCYADVARPDGMTQRIRDCADTWRNIRGMNDQQAAQLVRADQVDILVDLSVHSAGNRLLVFARKPAPVQVTYLGYCGTTGLEAIDYRLSDPYMDPPHPQEGEASVYSEQTVRLPRTYWCYEPGGPTPEVGALPAWSAGHITLGSMNNFAKVSHRALALWAQIMARVPGSKLMLCCPAGAHREKVIQVLEQGGVARERVGFVTRQPWGQYIASYQGIDIGLDSFPWNGGITTCDNLWMGVPVVTLMGQAAVGRAGSSILHNIGLEELIASSPEQYVTIASKLAGDLKGLEEMRRALRPRMRASPLMDARQFARDVELAYRQMWRRWCEGEAAKP